ncbi:MAG TPA: UPF0147 family protein [Candidatus Lokiarchaeia archaeon]|nr:UPF0147 family protein [Candidatus Lokiarchaeia archaeon]
MPRTTKSQKNAETQKSIDNTLYILDMITADNQVPRNIRRTADDAKNALVNGTDTAAVRASNAISLLDDLSNDPNCPVHTRTQIYQALSQLETIQD